MKIFVDRDDRQRKAVLIKMIFFHDTRKMAAITTNYFSSKMCKFHYIEFSLLLFLVCFALHQITINLTWQLSLARPKCFEICTINCEGKFISSLYTKVFASSTVVVNCDLRIS